MAVLLVVAFHAGLPLPGGFVGVDVFFVISGFVIMAMLYPQLSADGTLRLGTFYARRMRRLLPALALLIVFTAVASTVLLSPLGPQQATVSTGAAASLFTANLQLIRAGGGGYFDLPTEANALLHTWSLSVEEQFYLFLPALLIVGWRLTARLRARWSGRAAMASLLAPACALSFALSLRTSLGHGISRPEQFAFYSSPTRAWEFGTGALLALAAPSLTRLPRRAATMLGLVGATLVGFSALAMSSATTFPGTAALVPVAGAGLLLIAGTPSIGGVSHGLAAKPMVWIGGLSYSWYLWHWPIIVFARTAWPGNGWPIVASGVISLLPAWLAWRFVESPIRFNDRFAGRNVLPLAAVCILVPLVTCLTVGVIANRERGSATYARMEDELAVHADKAHGCDQATPLAKRTIRTCSWPAPGSAGVESNAAGTIFLVGDSNAGQFTEPVVAAAGALGHDLTVATRSGCPFVDAEVTGSKTPDDCHRYVLDTVEGLVAQKPELVVIASDSTGWVNDPGNDFRDQTTGRPAGTSAERADLWGQGLERVLRRLDVAGIPTLVVQTVPQYPLRQINECPPVRVMRDESSCGASSSRADIEAQQRPTREAELRAVGAVASARALDVSDQLCDPQRCSMYRDGGWLYRDSAHLSVSGSLTLIDRFRDTIATMLRPA